MQKTGSVKTTVKDRHWGKRPLAVEPQVQVETTVGMEKGGGRKNTPTTGQSAVAAAVCVVQIGPLAVVLFLSMVKTTSKSTTRQFAGRRNGAVEKHRARWFFF